MNIYVGNIAYTVTEESLKALFEKYGEVVSVKLITDKFTGNPRGFGFVKMATKEEATNAVEELNGTDFEGRKLIVNKARPRTNDRPGGGGGDRGGRGRY